MLIWAHMVVSLNRGPQYRPQHIIIRIMGTVTGDLVSRLRMGITRVPMWVRGVIDPPSIPQTVCARSLHLLYEKLPFDIGERHVSGLLSRNLI